VCGCFGKTQISTYLRGESRVTSTFPQYEPDPPVIRRELREKLEEIAKRQRTTVSVLLNEIIAGWLGVE
jgi:hypothetical protein